MLAASILFTFSFLKLVLGCGITTHIEVSHRAQDLWLHQPIYRKYVLQHQDALQGGSPFPDTMYDTLCYKGNLHQVAEDTHWYPFMKIAIEYMRERYPPPLTDDNIQGQKFLAFLLGIGSHQMADVVWHGRLTGCPNGFIDATAWESFDDDEEKAHSSVDPGGDSVVDYELPISYIGLTNKWYVPSSELQEIYKRYAIEYDTPLENNATSERVQVCSDLMFAGRFGDALFLGLEYPKYSHNNTFLLDSFHQYYYGGLPNMAQLTVRYWDQIVAMYERGTDICHLSNTNPYYLNCSINYENSVNQQEISYVRSRSTNYLPFSSHTAKPSNRLGVTPLKTGLISNQSYASFGYTSFLDDFNNDGLMDLVVSAPDYYNYRCALGGRVFIIYGKKDRPLIPDQHISIIEKVADQSIISPDCDGDRFGHAVTSLDWNNDGYQDLVVSSPSHGYGFRGAVFIFAGSQNGLSTVPYLRIDGINEHDTIGFELHTAHLDNDQLLDLIVTSPYAQPNGYDQPQQGAVWIFLSSQYSGQHQISINNASIKLFGDAAKSKFGYSLRVIPSSCMKRSSSPAIIISSPAKQGKLDIYLIESQQAHMLLTIQGKQEQAHFGQSFSINEKTCLLAVGSPTFSTDWYGSVDIIPLLDLFNRDDASILLSIRGNRIFERLGAQIHWTPQGDLVVSGPLGKQKFLPLEIDPSEGYVYIVSSNRIPTQTDPTPRSIQSLASLTYVAEHRLNRFGTRVNVLSSNSTSSYLMISSPYTELDSDVRLPGMSYFQILK